jgi:hypothetical protein
VDTREGETLLRFVINDDSIEVRHEIQLFTIINYSLKSELLTQGGLITIREAMVKKEVVFATRGEIRTFKRRYLALAFVIFGGKILELIRFTYFAPKDVE